ncbi:MAG: hypothetical protein WC775_00600 [Patescibacteria group bacterium]
MQNSDILRWIEEEQRKFKNNPILEKLLSLQTEVKRTIDEKVDEFIKEHGLAQKVSVPKEPLKICKIKSKTLEIPVNWRYLLSAPFIYSMIFPAIFWHVCLEVYHNVCFRLYGIPLVDRKQYFTYDRQLLSLLNFWEKFNCIYCSYVNNLIRYSAEIGGRTERYWCPIKYYRRIKNAHSQYDKFVDKQDLKHFRTDWKELRDFSDLD